MEPRRSTYRCVVESVAEGRVLVSTHALREAQADQLILGEVEAATLGGECIEDYPDDPRGASCLVLAWLSRGRRGAYVVALRLVADVCASCGERYLQRSDVLTIEDLRRRLDRGDLDGFRVTGELLEPVGAST